MARKIGGLTCQSTDSNFDIFRKVIDYCEDIHVKPYSVDRLFWLIGSGKLFKTKDRESDIFFQSDKFEFIKKWNSIK